MIDGKTILAIIPARGGSKGVPGKNVRKIAGKSLVARTIAAGRDSKYIDRLILSSDDRDIIAEAKLYGCEVPFTRPVELARDDTPGIDPVFHIDVEPNIVELHNHLPKRLVDFLGIKDNNSNRLVGLLGNIGNNHGKVRDRTVKIGLRLKSPSTMIQIGCLPWQR